MAEGLLWNATYSSRGALHGPVTAIIGMHPGTCNRPHAPPTPGLRQKAAAIVISDPNFTIDQRLSARQGARAMPPKRIRNGCMTIPALHIPSAHAILRRPAKTCALTRGVTSACQFTWVMPGTSILKINPIAGATRPHDALT